MSVMVKISARSMRQRFNGCDPDYIRTVCHGACCRVSTGGINVAVLREEEAALRARGAVVDGQRILPVVATGRCPFQDGASNLCGLHATTDKPFGCIASPFILTRRDTLVVRNRYRLLKCYDDGKRIPAYRAFYASLVLLLGEHGAAALATHLSGGGDDCWMPMRDDVHRAMRELEGVRHG